MEITIFGVLFIPLALFVAFFAQRYLLSLAILASVFQAASVFNVTGGSFELGVSPYYLVACLIFLHNVLSAVRGQNILPPKSDPRRSVIVILISFWILGAISAFLLPHIFAGLQVFDPRLGIDEQYNSPTSLRWTASNLAQAGYLTLNVGVVLYALRPSRAGHLKKALYVAISVVVGMSLLQILFAIFHVRLPMELLSSNPVYAQGEQSVGSLVRINGTFTEPSLAGAFLAASFVALLASFISGKRDALQYAALALIGLVLVSTTSSTGYFAAAASLLALAFYFSPLTLRGKLRMRYARGWIIVVTSAALAMTIILALPNLLEAAMAMTVQKGEGLSFLHRLAADLNAVELVRETFGIGVGLGSNRPSSLATYLLSNMGIAGTILFVALIRGLLRPFPDRKAPPHRHFIVWGFVTLLIAQIIAIPDLNFPLLWIFIALLVSNSAAFDRIGTAFTPMKARQYIGQ